MLAPWAPRHFALLCASSFFNLRRPPKPADGEKADQYMLKETEGPKDPGWTFGDLDTDLGPMMILPSLSHSLSLFDRQNLQRTKQLTITGV